jgi:signal transduction histidine kinase
VTEGSSTSSLFEATRLGLSRLALGHADELARALERACQASANALSVERVGIWFISTSGDELRCAALYELSRDAFSSGAVLRLDQLPGYLSSLEKHRVLTAPGADAPQVSASLRARYFEPLDIRATLDAPVFRLGEVVGVVRYEHIGSERQWSSRDRHFAGSVADLTAVLLEQATRLDVEAALSSQRERLAKAERMEALARMSAGVAHDFNNVLTAIMLRADTLRHDRGNDAELVAGLEEVLEAGERGARLVQQLLTFARARVPVPQPVDCSRTLRNLTPMLTTLTQGHTQLRVELGPGSALVSIDPSQLEQVIMNLVINARDASAHSDSEVVVRLIIDVDAVRLTVTDQGVGMDSATRDRIFEPFFSTKQRGSGLGLSTVYSIVQQAGGSVAVESREGQGSTFSVDLPRIQ